MNPYQILGIERGATLEQIKRAYRREAMKWHPDRNADSAEARDRFHRATEAYRRLTDEHEAAGKRRATADQQARDQGEQGPAGGRGGAQDSDYWDNLLDYAIRLAQSGHNESSIAVDLTLKGCPESLALAIAEKAFNINAHYAPRGEAPESDSQRASFKSERQENDLLRAFLGERNRLLSRRETIEYYLVAFSRFRHRANANPLTWISPNRRLLRLFYFSALLFAALAVVLHFLPGPSEYKLFPDLVLLQVPFALLALSFVWMVYRKLWWLTLATLLLYFATIAYYNQTMPAAFAGDPVALIGVAAVCFAPFALAVMFANYIYYRKAMKLVDEARSLFESHDERLSWIRHRAGTSTGAALVFLVGFSATMLYLVPQDGPFSKIPGFKLFDAESVESSQRSQQIRQRLDDAANLFTIAEKYYHADPPDYMKAEMAYTSAAGDGSLLAAYQLGYMYFHGYGVEPNPRLAHFYFEQATLAPLAFQPHSLELTTRYLAEAFNNLGIIYYRGLGKKVDRERAREMFRRGTEFGSNNARRNYERLRRGGSPVDTKIVAPEFRR